MTKINVVIINNIIGYNEVLEAILTHLKVCRLSRFSRICSSLPIAKTSDLGSYSDRVICLICFKIEALGSRSHAASCWVRYARGPSFAYKVIDRYINGSASFVQYGDTSANLWRDDGESLYSYDRSSTRRPRCNRHAFGIPQLQLSEVNHCRGCTVEVGCAYCSILWWERARDNNQKF